MTLLLTRLTNNNKRALVIIIIIVKLSIMIKVIYQVLIKSYKIRIKTKTQLRLRR